MPIHWSLSHCYPVLIYVQAYLLGLAMGKAGTNCVRSYWVLEETTSCPLCTSLQCVYDCTGCCLCSGLEFASGSRALPVPGLYWANAASIGPVQARYWHIRSLMLSQVTLYTLPVGKGRVSLSSADGHIPVALTNFLRKSTSATRIITDVLARNVIGWFQLWDWNQPMALVDFSLTTEINQWHFWQENICYSNASIISQAVEPSPNAGL